MGQNFVKVVEDGTLAAKGGWAFALDEASGDIGFITEKSAMTDEQKINEVWDVAAHLVIEQAVRDGIVQWVDNKDARREPDEFSGGRRVAL